MALLYRLVIFFLTLPVLIFSDQLLAETSTSRVKTTTKENRASSSGTPQSPSLKCVDCHAEIKGTRARPEHDHGKCESCHTGGTSHLQAMLKAAPAKGSISIPESKTCLSCHGNDKQLMNWHFGAHGKADGTCKDCHSIHSSPTGERPNMTSNKTDKTSTLCISCHQDVKSQFNMASHHPVKEGGMSCTSCHDPHGGNQTVLKSKNEQCLSCHQALRGPKVFEHAPVAEDCMSCHSPHGSTNRRLLTVAQPAACLQCHAIAQGKHGYGTAVEPTATSGTRTTGGAVLRSCTNCHSAIHGSHQDPLLRH
ncbi:MAG: cytochrome c3 family protein [Rhodoferax sp.]|uniref:cytochrome c3 family protein n=1 Tax=Rhodoferax sp. TaxID=50421 RepID=UPI0027178BDA|nr:cytochrome c3 family protein [Rhodoferax sp.]MDO8449212.1 cytochrome c3 family protein [Rhodoferax sp.]